MYTGNGFIKSIGRIKNWLVYSNGSRWNIGTTLKISEVYLLEDVTIKPRRELCMVGCINQNVKGTLLFELKKDITCNIKYGIQMNNSVCEIKQQRIPVQLVNFSNETVNLKQGTKMRKVITAEEVFVTTAIPKTYGLIELKDTKLTQE